MAYDINQIFYKVYLHSFGRKSGGDFKTYRNVLIVFLVSGLWHGANWTFILWGVCHGFFSVITRRYKSFFNGLHPALNWMITFMFINITWVIFRAGTIREGVRLLNRIVLLDFRQINGNITASFNLPEFLFLNDRVMILKSYPQFFVILFFTVAMWLMLGSQNAYEKMQKFVPKVGNMITTVLLLVWCIFSFSGLSTFLYFNF